VKLLSTAAVWSFAGLFIIPNWIHAQSPLGLGDRNPSTPSQISAAKSEASSEHSFFTTTLHCAKLIQVRLAKPLHRALRPVASE
jgi:hypothetical protein